MVKERNDTHVLTQSVMMLFIRKHQNSSISEKNITVRSKNKHKDTGGSGGKGLICHRNRKSDVSYAKKFQQH